jgi:hypothetical protein
MNSISSSLPNYDHAAAFIEYAKYKIFSLYYYFALMIFNNKAWTYGLIIKLIRQRVDQPLSVRHQ